MKRIRLLQVTKNTYCVQRVSALSCSYYVVTPEGIVLVDSGMDVDGEDMRFGLKEKGFDFQDVTSILITHWHNDHSSGAAAIKETSDSLVMSHQDSVERLARRERARGIRGLVAKALPIRGLFGPLRGLLELAPPRAIEVEQCVVDQERILDDFIVVETPGHVAGHVSFFYEPDGVLFTGDALAVAHDKLSFMSRFLTQDKEAARQSMLRCLDLEPDVYCPGHREPLAKPSSEHVGSLRKRLENLRWWPIIGCGE